MSSFFEEGDSTLARACKVIWVLCGVLFISTILWHSVKFDGMNPSFFRAVGGGVLVVFVVSAWLTESNNPKLSQIKFIPVTLISIYISGIFALHTYTESQNPNYRAVLIKIEQIEYDAKKDKEEVYKLLEEGAKQ